MNPDEAQEFLRRRFHVPRETLHRLREFTALVLDENGRQNLIAKSTEALVWERHILDSAQLLTHTDASAKSWLDVGSGAGFPGMVIAIMTNAQHHLVEPRRRRADFLEQAVDRLGMAGKVKVTQANVEQLPAQPYHIVTARAVSGLSALLGATRHLSDAGTVWLLHKGRSAAEEVANARRDWNAHFELLPSITSAEASVVRVQGLSGRRGR